MDLTKLSKQAGRIFFDSYFIFLKKGEWVLKKLMKRIQFIKWILEQKFRKKEYSIWDDWYLNSSKPYIWDRSFLKKEKEK
jgi:hypothetical protein